MLALAYHHQHNTAPTVVVPTKREARTAGPRVITAAAVDESPKVLPASASASSPSSSSSSSALFLSPAPRAIPPGPASFGLPVGAPEAPVAGAAPVLVVVVAPPNGKFVTEVVVVVVAAVSAAAGEGVGTEIVG